MPANCSPLTSSVNQLTIAMTYAAAPSKPTPPVRDDQYTGPERIACGMARIGRSAVVSRLRGPVCGAIVMVTG